MKHLIISISVSVFAVFAHAQDYCSNPVEELSCENEGFRTSYRQGFSEPNFSTNLLAYEYSGSEFFTGLYGLQCGIGASYLTAIVYGQQAEGLYGSLDLPEKREDFGPKNTYKRLNIDGTTEDQTKPYLIACQRRLNPILNELETNCYLSVNRVPRRFPCSGERRVYEFEGKIGGLKADRLSKTLNTNHLTFLYSNGKHTVDCDPSEKTCTLRVELNRSL